MTKEAIGNDGLTISGIYSLLDSIFNDKLKMICPNINAARTLYIAKGIEIPDSLFKQVKFGEFQVLVYDGYLGKANRNYLFDFAVINNQPTIFLFSDPLLNEKVRMDLRISRIFSVFNFLVQLYYDLNWYYSINTIFTTIMLYTPMVLTVRLYERYYGKEFDMANFNPELFTEDIEVWFNQEAIDIIHSMDDHMLFEYGGLVEHVDASFNAEREESDTE